MTFAANLFSMTLIGIAQLMASRVIRAISAKQSGCATPMSPNQIGYNVTRRSKPTAKFKLSIWKQDGKLWYCKPMDLVAAAFYSKNDYDEMKRRMGEAFKYIGILLDGGRVDQWAVQMVEHGLSADTLGVNSTVEMPADPYKKVTE